MKKGFKFCLDIRNKKTIPGPVDFDTIVASNVQLSWFMKFAMNFFIPYLLVSNPIFHTI